jgi:hypothetical protein
MQLKFRRPLTQPVNQLASRYAQPRGASHPDRQVQMDEWGLLPRRDGDEPPGPVVRRAA